MTLGRLLLREIRHRKFNFLTGIICVSVAVGGGVGAKLSLESFDRQTRVLEARMDAGWEKDQQAHQDRIQRNRDELHRKMKAYQDTVRKNMLNLGFNLMIVHKDLNLAAPAIHGMADTRTYLPQSYAKTLADKKLVAINHLVSFLQVKYLWPERQRWVTIWGTTHEVYIRNPMKQKPIVKAVRDHTVSLGYGIHKGLGLSPGDTITLGGKGFKVLNCYPQESPDADERIIVPLAAAQELLGKPDKVTGLLAVDCNCNPTALPELEKNIQKVLPDTRVLNWRTQWMTRLKTRKDAAEAAKALVARAEQELQGAKKDYQLSRVTTLRDRDEMRARRTTFGAAVIVLVVIFSAVFMGLLMWDNVRRRKAEIGVLRAIGITRGSLLMLFVGKALLIGLFGAVLGYTAGAVIAAVSLNQWDSAMDPVLLGVSILGASVLAALASWIPAQLAAGIDPAVALQQENV